MYAPVGVGLAGKVAEKDLEQQQLVLVWIVWESASEDVEAVGEG